MSLFYCATDFENTSKGKSNLLSLQRCLDNKPIYSLEICEFYSRTHDFSALADIISHATALTKLSFGGNCKQPFAPTFVEALRLLPALCSINVDHDLFLPSDTEQHWPCLTTIIGKNWYFNGTLNNQFVMTRLKELTISLHSWAVDFTVFPSLERLTSVYSDAPPIILFGPKLCFIDGDVPIDTLLDSAKEMQCFGLSHRQQFTKSTARRSKLALSPCSQITEFHFEKIDLSYCNLSDGTLRLVSDALANQQQCTNLSLGGTITLRGISYFLKRCTLCSRDNFRSITFRYFDRKPSETRQEFLDLSRFISINFRLNTLKIACKARKMRRMQEIVSTMDHNDDNDDDNDDDDNFDIFLPTQKTQYYPRVPLTLAENNAFLAALASHKSLTSVSCIHIEGNCKEFPIHLSSSLPCTVREFSLFANESGDAILLEVARKLLEKWNLNKITLCSDFYYNGKKDVFDTFVANTKAIVTNINNVNISLQRLMFGPYSCCFTRSDVDRLRLPRVGRFLVDLYLTLMPLHLPPYIMLDIVNLLIPGIELVSDAKKVSLYSSVCESVQRLRETKIKN